jgi:diguanylate cyclase (GGDEF)-like protein
MIMALLGLEQRSTDWQQVTEGIIGDLFEATAHVFPLTSTSTNTPITAWAIRVARSLYFADLKAHGVTILDGDEPIRSVLTAIDRASGYGITVSTTTARDFNPASLAVVEDCLRIYVIGIALIEHARNRPKESSLLTSILSSIDIGILGIAEGGRILFANRQAGELLGHTPGELVRANSNAIVAQFEEYFAVLGASSTPWLTTNTLLRKPSGKPQPASLSIRRIEPNQSISCRYLVSLVDTTRSHFELEEWRWHASHDPLTGILNRNGLANEVKRLADGPVMVLFIDINRFKVINDLLGHRGGDRVIISVAQRLVAATKPNDIVARVGGDEFVVVGSMSENMRGLKRIAQRIVDSVITQPIDVGDRQLAVSISMGAALETIHGGIDALLGRADHAMYEAKQASQTLRLARGDEDIFANDSQLVDPNLFEFLRALDTDQVLAEEHPWEHISDQSRAGLDLALAWREPILETPRDYAMRNHLRNEYNWLLLHHLLRRQSISGRIGISPLNPGPHFVRRLKTLSQAGYLNPSKIQLVFRSIELSSDDSLAEAGAVAREAQEIGISIALRWSSGEGGEIANVAYLRPNQVQVNLADWLERSPSAKLASGLAAFAHSLALQVAFIHPNGKLLSLLKSPRIQELMPNALVMR